ncbi:MAG: SSS family solute:Na+ symporter [Saprospiraceae bacterium]|jgi:SSS family solute:Na+ symporter
MNTGISNIDIAIVISYLCLVIMIGFWVARKTKTGEDLFLGGRTFGWGLIGLSLFASNISSSTIIGLSGAAYSTGIVDSVYEWMSGLPLIIAAVIFVPMYLKSKITTIPEFLERRYDRRSQLFFSAVTIFSTIVIETAGALYAGSLVLEAFFPSLEGYMWGTTFVLALIAGIYTASGGLKAVVYTDAIQAVILIVGCSILTYILFEKVDFDWSRVVAAAPEGHLSVVRSIDAEGKILPWLGLLIGVPFLGFWYWSTNQYIIQRVLGAKDIRHARWGVIFAGFLKIIPLFVMVIPGALAMVIYPGVIAEQDAVFPFLVTNVLPVGLVGLVLAGLISAIMSSVDSALNASSTLIVIDFIKPNRPNITQGQIVRYGRITTLVLMVIAALWAPQIQNFDGLWGYLQQMFSIIVPPIAVIFLVGVFYKRGNGDGAFWTLVISTLLGIGLFLLGENGYWHLHYTINVGIMVLVATVIFILVSLMTKPPTKEQTELFTFRKELIMDGMHGLPWYQDYRLHMAVLVGLIGYILYLFW